MTKSLMKLLINVFQSVKTVQFIIKMKENVTLFKKLMDANVINDTITLQNNVKIIVKTDCNGLVRNRNVGLLLCLIIKTNVNTIKGKILKMGSVKIIVIGLLRGMIELITFVSRLDVVYNVNVNKFLITQPLNAFQKLNNALCANFLIQRVKSAKLYVRKN